MTKLVGIVALISGFGFGRGTALKSAARAVTTDTVNDLPDTGARRRRRSVVSVPLGDAQRVAAREAECRQLLTTVGI